MPSTLDSQLASPPQCIRARGALRLLLVALIALAMWPAAASAAAPPNDDYFSPTAINSPGTALRGSYATSATTFEATELNFNNNNSFFCTFQGSTIWYAADVWYTFYPHRNGRISVIVQGKGGFTPVATVYPFSGVNLNFSASLCNGSTPPINRVTLPSNGTMPVSAGQGYRIQIGGANTPNQPDNDGAGPGFPSTGNYDLAFAYDPDSDGDGLLDSQDRCDGQRGSALLQGCADSDGDGLADVDDRCARQRGPANLRGCADSDTDGRPDIDDRCPAYDASDRDPNRDGCLDLHLLVDSKIVPAGVYRGGRIIRSLRVLKVPRGARVSVKCRRPRGRRNCGSTLVRKATTASVRATIARTLSIRKVRRKRLPYGSKISIRVTKAGATGWYRSYTVLRSARVFKISDRCSNVGSSKLLKRGCR